MFCGMAHHSDCLCRLCGWRMGLSSKALYRRQRRRAIAASKKERGDEVKRPEPGKIFGPRDVEWYDKEFMERWPEIYEWMCLQSYPAGGSRVTSTILLFCDAGAIKLCFNDRDNNRSVFINDATFTGAMDRLECGLKKDDLDWRRKGSNNSSSTSTPF